MDVQYRTPINKTKSKTLKGKKKIAARYILNNYNFVKGQTKKQRFTRMDKTTDQRARIKVTTFYKGINGFIDIPTKQY